MPLETHQRAHRQLELAQLVRSAQLRQVDDEAGGEQLGAGVAQQLDRALGSAAGRDQVVDQDDAVARVTASSCISISSRPYSSE